MTNKSNLQSAKSSSAFLALDIINFCAIECKLQGSGELSVGWMCNAWVYAMETSTAGTLGIPEELFPTVADIIQLGRLVEPEKNRQGFRTQAVWVGGQEKAPWKFVPSMMVELVRNIDAIKTTNDISGWFLLYEDCHPFLDGNGRTGVILFNWLRGSLWDPVWAPNFWHDPRRVHGYGLTKGISTEETW